MRLTRISLSVVALLFLFAIIPYASNATTLTVSKVCSAATPTPCFTTISGAISQANPTTTSDNIVVLPGTYAESITLKDSLPISGIETSRTIIQNPGSGAVITASQLNSVSLTKLTIDIGSGTGIQATNSTLTNVANNIFRGVGGTAITIQNTSRIGGAIDHNTFFHYQTAISSDVDLTISNNIFYGNGTSTALAVIAGGTGTFTQFQGVTYNDFYQNQTPASTFIFDDSSTPTFIAHSSNIPNLTIQNPDPLFVDPNNTNKNLLDYHVQQGSPTLATGTGTPPDMGAFGGSGADTIPFPVTMSPPVKADPTTATITWSPNLAWNVTDDINPGSYDVTYALNTGGTNTINVLAPGTTTDIPGLVAAATPPGAPTLTAVAYGDGTLTPTWFAGDNATGYFVNYRETGGTTVHQINVRNVTTYTIAGLVNGQKYDVWITPYAQAIYSFAVYVLDNTGSGYVPGVSHESVSSPAMSLAFGNPVPGPDSNTITEFPEPVQPTPNLSNSGCFIATAAYGYYSAPEVQLLRDFRDRYLLTNGPGRAFANWYYRYGPIGAAYMNSHPWIKPAVRAALLPLISLAFFMLETSFAFKLACLLCLGLISGIMMRKKYSMRSGGAR